MNSSKIKIVVISDIHYSPNAISESPKRKGNYGDILLLRAVHRVNRYIKPDLVLILGDLVNDGDIELLKKIHKITSLIKAQTIVLPGNHDCAPKLFYDIFPEPPDYVDLNGFRFLSFCDAEKPEYNAERSDADIEIMKSLASNFSGPVISCQHVPLFKPETAPSPYNYTNADEIVEAMTETGVTVSISGHYHKGFVNTDQPFGSSVTAPALCEAPFGFLEIDIDQDSNVELTNHSLALPKEYELFDYHVHSHYAYCNENMDFAKSVELAEMFNLKGLSFSEHSGHLYYSQLEYHHNTPSKKPSSPHSASKTSRIDEYLLEVAPFRTNNSYLGFEVDCDFTGNGIIDPVQLKLADILLGAIHSLPESCASNQLESERVFKCLMEKFMEFPMRILAHPFRIFRRSNLDIPENLFPLVISLLKKHNVAAELNFHTNEPSEPFFQMCLNENVKIVFGSDSHNLYEVGEFYPHIQFMEKIGYTFSGLKTRQL